MNADDVIATEVWREQHYGHGDVMVRIETNQLTAGPKLQRSLVCPCGAQHTMTEEPAS